MYIVLNVDEQRERQRIIMIAKSCDVVRGTTKGHRNDNKGNCSSRRVGFVDTPQIFEYDPPNMDPHKIQVKTADHKHNQQMRKQSNGFRKVQVDDERNIEARRTKNAISVKKAKNRALRYFMQIRH